MILYSHDNLVFKYAIYDNGSNVMKDQVLFQIATQENPLVFCGGGWRIVRLIDSR